jgi:hypothetical protein
VVTEDDTAYSAIANELLGAGWQIAATTQREADVVVALTVAEPADAQSAVLTALAGAGVLVRARASVRVVDDLVDDLRRIGHVLIADATTTVVLDVETWRLLHALGQGATLAGAAGALHMSTRTANRRITVARAALNTPTRAQLQRAIGARTRVAPAPSLMSRWRPATG